MEKQKFEMIDEASEVDWEKLRRVKTESKRVWRERFDSGVKTFTMPVPKGIERIGFHVYVNDKILYKPTANREDFLSFIKRYVRTIDNPSISGGYQVSSNGRIYQCFGKSGVLKKVVYSPEEAEFFLKNVEDPNEL